MIPTPRPWGPAPGNAHLDSAYLGAAMRRLALTTLVLTVLLAACTRPIDADFEGNDPGLKDDELFWVLRVPAQVGALPWKPITTSADSIKIATFNKPVFEQVMPALLRDLMDGRLAAYEDLEVSEEEKPITDLRERVARMSGSDNFQPYSQMFEVLGVVRSSKGRYSHEVRYIRLIWKDPANPSVERSLGCVRMSDLELTTYPVVLGGARMSFADYLRREPYYSYPAYVRSNEVEYRLISAAEAGYLYQMVREGSWDRISWIEGAINISGLSWADVGNTHLKRMSGVYEFPPADSATGNRVLYLEPEQGYLLADWTHKFRNEKVFPFDTAACFNAGGEMLFFFAGTSQQMDSVVFISGPDTVLGHRTKTL